MPYAVSAALASDIPTLSTVQWAALLSNPLTQTLYPKGPTSALANFTSHSYQKAIKFPSVKLIKATDEHSGEIVAFAKWILYPENKDKLIDFDHETTPEDSNGGWAVEEAPSRPEDVDERALKAWNRAIDRTRRKILANKRHSCSRKDGCSLECYFASLAPVLWGKPLYQSYPCGTSFVWLIEPQCLISSIPIRLIKVEVLLPHSSNGVSILQTACEPSATSSHPQQDILSSANTTS